MEEDDKGCPMIRMGLSGWMFLRVLAYPGSPGQRALNGCVCVCVVLIDGTVEQLIRILLFYRTCTVDRQCIQKLVFMCPSVKLQDNAMWAVSQNPVSVWEKFVSCVSYLTSLSTVITCDVKICISDHIKFVSEKQWTVTTTTCPFNGLFSRTTWVSWYQKDKTGLDLNEARDDGVWGWRWHQLDHMQTDR